MKSSAGLSNLVRLSLWSELKKNKILAVLQPITSALCTTFNWMCSYLVVSLTPTLQVIPGLSHRYLMIELTSRLPVTSCIVNSAAIYIMVVKFRNTIWPPPSQLSLHRRAALSSSWNGTRSYITERTQNAVYIVRCRWAERFANEFRQSANPILADYEKVSGPFCWP
jgi:hypothetical protein